jgi:hypothetical protein
MAELAKTQSKPIILLLITQMDANGYWLDWFPKDVG